MGNKSVGKDAGRLVPSYPAADTGKMQQFLRKLDMALPYSPAIPPLGVYPEELETCSNTKTYIHYVHRSTVHISQKVRQTQMSIR